MNQVAMHHQALDQVQDREGDDVCLCKGALVELGGPTQSL